MICCIFVVPTQIGLVFIVFVVVVWVAASFLTQVYLDFTVYTVYYAIYIFAYAIYLSLIFNI